MERTTTARSNLLCDLNQLLLHDVQADNKSGNDKVSSLQYRGLFVIICLAVCLVSYWERINATFSDDGFFRGGGGGARVVS